MIDDDVGETSDAVLVTLFQPGPSLTRHPEALENPMIFFTSGEPGVPWGVSCSRHRWGIGTGQIRRHPCVSVGQVIG